MDNVKYQVLKNRGIENVREYLTLGTSCLNDPILFGADKLEEAKNMIDDAELFGKKVYILVDTDTDGYASAAIMYMYLKNNIGIENVQYILNDEKKHGLQEDTVSYLLNEAMMNEIGSLLIIPDAGSNDVEQCKQLALSYDIIILDHHEKDVDNPYAVVINPQGSDYPNKNLCGAGVVYKFLNYMDDSYGESWSNQYIDLMAVAMVADIMDLRDYESRFLTTRGLMNVENKFLKTLISKKSFDIVNPECPNAYDIAFYISPLINACIRVGSKEDHDILFRAFIGDEHETFFYTPRKSKNNPDPVSTFESIYDKAARICTSAKSKQDRTCEKETENIAEYFYMNPEAGEHKLIIWNCGEFDKVLTGVLANKVANKLQKPTIIVRNYGDKLSGSARNCRNSFVLDFKKDVNESGFVEKAAGHSSAFGVEITQENANNLVNYFENLYKDVEAEPTYYVDYWLQDSIPFQLVREINEMRALFSSFVEEPYIAISNVVVAISEISIETTASNGNKRFVFVKDDVEYVKFRLPSNDEFLKIQYNSFGNEYLRFNFVGKAKLNIMKGTATPQFIIDDYDVEVIDI